MTNREGLWRQVRYDEFQGYFLFVPALILQLADTNSLGLVSASIILPHYSLLSISRLSFHIWIQQKQILMNSWVYQEGIFQSSMTKSCLEKRDGAVTAASQLVFTDCFHSICRAALEGLGWKLKVDTAVCPMLAITLQTAIMTLKHKIYFITCLLQNLAQTFCNLNAQTYDQNSS